MIKVPIPYDYLIGYLTIQTRLYNFYLELRTKTFWLMRLNSDWLMLVQLYSYKEVSEHITGKQVLLPVPWGKLIWNIFLIRKLFSDYSIKIVIQSRISHISIYTETHRLCKRVSSRRFSDIFPFPAEFPFSTNFILQFFQVIFSRAKLGKVVNQAKL